MIDFRDVSIAFGTQTVLNCVSFGISSGEHVGIVGPNGSGKSTIFNLLNGELRPDSGQVSVPRNMTQGYLRQQLQPDVVNCSLLSYAENASASLNNLHGEIDTIQAALPASDGMERKRLLDRLGDLQTEFEHRGGYEIGTRAKTALSGLGFSVDKFDQPFSSFSGGWQMRAELARALVSRPDLLMLDEPTNFLDIPAVEWLQGFLREYKGTLLLISHDRYMLNSLTKTTLEVFGGHVTRYSGNYERYLVQRTARHEQLVAAKKNQDRHKAQVGRFIERFRAKNTKATLVKSAIKKLEKLDEIVVPAVAVRRARIRLPSPPHCGQEVMRLDDAGISYDGKTWVLRHVDLRIERGEKTALVGLNGMGKSSLLRVLSGGLPLAEGRCVCGHKVVVGYQSQDLAETIDPSTTVFEAAKDATPGLTEQSIRSVLGSFLFSGDTVEKRVGILSGGEKMRLALACMLLRAPNLLLLDEPTTHLDIPSREALEDALVSYEGTLLIVSHDIEFVKKVATQIIAMVPQNIRRYPGDYIYYREKSQEDIAVAIPASGTTRGEPGISANSRKASRQERAFQRQEIHRATKELKKKITANEKRMEALDAERMAVVEQLQAGGAKGAVDFEELGRKLKQLHKDIERITSHWERDSLELEAVMKELASTGDDKSPDA